MKILIQDTKGRTCGDVDDLRKCNHGVPFNCCAEHWADYLKYLSHLSYRPLLRGPIFESRFSLTDPLGLRQIPRKA